VPSAEIQVPCGVFQVITWGSITWPENEPEAARFVCGQCGEQVPERHKPPVLEQGEWRATAPGDGPTASFHLSVLYSPFVTWGEIARDFLLAKEDSALLQTWTNLKLGEPFEDRDTTPASPDWLAERAEEWGPGLPEGVVAITCGVDVQDARLEYEILGWGVGGKWSLDDDIIHGDTTGAEVWKGLDDTVKHTTYARLRLQETAGAGVSHFPKDREYFWYAGLVSERPVRKYAGGVARMEWIVDRGVRNEPLDCRVYATAALHGLYAHGLRLQEQAEKIAAAMPREEGEAPAAPPERPRVIRSAYMQRSRR
jgi:phage terminase large subunit GpA-like protein